MIFLAARPRAVFLATWERNMSPVACGVSHRQHSGPESEYLRTQLAYQMTAFELFLDVRRLGALSYSFPKPISPLASFTVA